MIRSNATKQLEPIYENVKSYYRKAWINEYKNSIMLFSYNTHVVTIYKNADFTLGKVTVNGMYSATTLRHIKEFLKQYGYKADSKNQIVNDYM